MNLPVRRAFLLLVAGFAPLLPLRAAPQFSAINLNLLLPNPVYPPGPVYPENADAAGLSASGAVVGGAQYQNGLTYFFPFLYQNGAAAPLSPESGFDAASAISDNGAHIVGTIGFQPAIYVGSGSWAPLADAGFVYSVNNSAVAVGEVYHDDTGTFHATSFYSGTAQDLGTLGGDTSVANGINNAGLIVGQSNTADSGCLGFVYQGGSMTPLASLVNDPSYFSSANAINELGQVVGWSETVDTYLRHATIWTDDGSGYLIQDLGVLDGFDESSARDINNLGHVVGTLDGFSGAFYYDGTTMWNLQDLIVNFSEIGLTSLRGAYAINDLGQIVGTGYDADSNQIAFVLTLVPEPSSFTLLALGLTPFLRRRRSAP